MNTKRRAFKLYQVLAAIFVIFLLVALLAPSLKRQAQETKNTTLEHQRQQVIDTLLAMRNAIKAYSCDHDGAYPPLAEHLISKTSKGGGIGEDLDVHVFGPYLRTIPSVPFGNGMCRTKFSYVFDEGMLAPCGGNTGWVYMASTGRIIINMYETDKDGVPYWKY